MATLSPLPGYRAVPDPAPSTSSPSSPFNAGTANHSALTALVPRVALLGHADTQHHALPNHMPLHAPGTSAHAPGTSAHAPSTSAHAPSTSATPNSHPRVALHQSSRAGRVSLLAPAPAAPPLTTAATFVSRTPPLNIWTIFGFVMLLVLLILACTCQAKAAHTAQMVDHVSWRLARLEHMLAVVASRK